MVLTQLWADCNELVQQSDGWKRVKRDDAGRVLQTKMLKIYLTAIEFLR